MIYDRLHVSVCMRVCVGMDVCECNAGAAVSLSRSLTLLSVQHSNRFISMR